MPLTSCPPIEDFTVWWICALPIELAAAREVLDEIYDAPNIPQYTLGRIGIHKTAVACLPAGQTGLSSATATVKDLHHTFPSLKHGHGLMVGIAGGVPGVDADIRLGDVVISQPQGCNGGVVQYDFGKVLTGGQLSRTGSLNNPPQDLLVAVSNMKSNEINCKRNIDKCLKKLANPPVRKDQSSKTVFNRPPARTDRLFEPYFNHVKGELCNRCLREKEIKRTRRLNEDAIAIHYGTIASGNRVIKDGLTRDRLSAELGGVLCFEMEAAGLMNSFPCLIIRGICDYADSHKNKAWQPFAAAAAASCAKEVLSFTISPKLKANYHQSLVYNQINSRRATIKVAHSKTCGWFLERPEYRHWLDSKKLSSHHGLLWLKGKPGAGKSTIMKFAYTTTSNRFESPSHNTVVLSFYFNARGVALEKTCTGMYRSLLFQLLDSFSDLQHVFGWLPPTMSEDQRSYLWETHTLQILFGHAVEQIGSRSVICFIDALDECDEDEVREMISFFETIGNLAASSGLEFRSCFSSRHYPHIFIQNGLEMILEDQAEHSQDITNYLHSELRNGRSKILEIVKTEILKKASGVFLWVVLVVPMLNKAYDHGRVHALSDLLNELPKGLDELFDKILSRDGHSREELILCLQWILFAREPLRPEELYFAIQTGVNPKIVNSWDPTIIDPEDIHRYILSVSKGLTELTKSKNTTVHFIHESVRDYLFEPGWLQRFAPDLIGNFSALSHERLKQICEGYTTMTASRKLGSMKAVLSSFSSEGSAKFFRKKICEQFPFFNYAVRNLLYHADLAAAFGVSQGTFLDSLFNGSWLALRNFVEEDKNQRYSSEASRLYILVKESLPELVVLEAKQTQEIDVPQHDSPLLVTLKRMDEKVLRVLLTSETKIHTGTRICQSQTSSLSQDEQDAAIRYLLTFNASFALAPLAWAASKNNVNVVKILVNTGKVDVNAKDPAGRTPLLLAAGNGHEEIVELILNTGKADVNSTDPEFGQTPLSLAARYGYETVVKLLLETGEANISFRDTQYGRTPLSLAAEHGHEAVVKLLLDTGEADINSRDARYGQTPLSFATEHGHDAVVKLLLDTGRADTDIADTFFSCTTPSFPI